MVTQNIWKSFVKSVAEYNLIDEGDCIAVCISGGKDSFVLAKCLQRLQFQNEKAAQSLRGATATKQSSPAQFSLKFICMDAGYRKESIKSIKENAKKLEIPLKFFKTDIFKVVKKAGGSPCYLCARMRRGFLYSTAQKLGCNKIALGHHMSDVVETTLMGMLYGAQFQVMMPKLKSRNFNGM